MKNLVFLLLFFACTTFLPAQGAFRIGGHYGLHQSTLQFSGTGGIAANGTVRPLLGYRYGMLLEIPLVSRLCVRTGGDIVISGTKQENPQYGYSSKLEVYNFQVPVMLAYSGQYFFIGAGGYGNIGWTGTFEVTRNNPESSYFAVQKNIKLLQFGISSDDDLTRTDYGLIGEVGLRYKYFELSGYYLQGIKNINPPYSEYKTKVKNKSVGVSLSFIYTLKKTVW